MKIGTEMDERCNRPIDDHLGDPACHGTMMVSVGDNCSCHISPPCGSCLDAPLVCTVCGAESGDE